MGKWPCTRTPEDVSGDAVAMTTVSAVHVDAAATLRTEQASGHVRGRTGSRSLHRINPLDPDYILTSKALGRKKTVNSD